MRRPLAALTALGVGTALATVLTGTSGSSAVAACDPFTDPVYAGQTPTGEEVLGFDFGEEEVTAAQMQDYLAAVDDARDDVSTGSLGTTPQGREIGYALVGDPADVRAAQVAAHRLRNPATTPAQAAQIADDAPAIVWMAGNVHGGEESGGDAALKMLYELSDRTDCAATAIRDNTVTVIVPSQNPDGRELDTRRNAYGFDLNRDWFARTQAETDGKLDFMRQYPPALMSDNHEMGGTEFFFPPNADPVHHEVADRSVTWINDLYGGAMADAFNDREWPFFNYEAYDLLYMGYGDTVPTTGFLGASMTFEKGNASPIDERTEQQFVATWASMSALATNKASVQRGIAANYRQALAQGKRGHLEPNAVFAPGSELELQVPDEKVRNYFILNQRPKQVEALQLVSRLQGMGVQVRRLTAPLKVKDFRPYGEKARAQTLPKGTFWVPMAQAQKHWVQAMLGEDSYVPFPYFYDVTAWSQPMLFNVPAGRSGLPVKPKSKLLGESGIEVSSAPDKTIGVLLTDDGTSAYESEGWLRWLLEKKWDQPYRKLTPADLGEGGLAPVDVLVVPNGDADQAYDDLGAVGRKALREWLAKGGRYVGYRGGTELAARLGLTTAQLREPTSDVPGSLIRVNASGGPLSRGVGTTAWNFYEYDAVMTTHWSSTAFRYPAGKRFFVSGYEQGADELRGTTAIAAERYSRGQVVVFAGDPNFRAFTDGTQKILWNAMFTSNPAWWRTRPDVTRLPGRVDAARQAAGELRSLQELAMVTVRSADAGKAIRAIDGDVQRTELGDGLVRLSWSTPDEDGHAVLATVLDDLSGIDVVSARVP